MAPATGPGAEISRRALLKISESTILSAVDGLDLRGHAKISAVVGIPLRNLQQRRDVAAFAAAAPIAAVTALLELLAMAPLERVIAALGEHADAPNFEQLSAAIDAISASGATLDLAINNAYEDVRKIHFDGMHYRKDIGQKGLKRW